MVIIIVHNSNAYVVGSAVCDATFEEQLNQSFSSTFSFVIKGIAHKHTSIIQ